MYIFDKWGLKVWTVLNIVLLFLSINFTFKGMGIPIVEFMREYKFSAG